MDELPKTTLDTLLDGFQEDCNQCRGLYYTILRLNNDYPTDFSIDLRNIIVEHGLLQTFGKWERFLESIFIEYMMGRKSKNGNTVNRYVVPVDEQHAYRMIQNVTTYPDWTDIAKITTNAENFFENGGPFLLLTTMKSELNAIKKLRNFIAHHSEKSRKDFEDLVRGKIGYLPDDITPAVFLVDYKVGKKKTDLSFFEHYIQFLSDAARLLVEYNENTT